nr:immunoglobulin light chain junction region [Macaca mulatta]
CQQYTDLLPTF